MVPLLVVMVAGCALASAVHIGRGLWDRARSVERHHQALDTLADLTNRGDGTSRAVDHLDGHQAHVRIIGPSAPTDEALTPSKSVSPLASRRSSPFRRPSRSAPSLAAMDAVATSTSLGTSPHAQVLRTRPRQLPYAPPMAAQAHDDRTLPGRLPPQPLALALGTEPSTRPVPVVQPQVFHFGEAGMAPTGRPPVLGPPVLGPPVPALARPAQAGPGPASAPAGPGPDGPTDLGPAPAPGTTEASAGTSAGHRRAHRDQGGPKGRHRSVKRVVAPLVAVAAVCVAIVAVEANMGGPKPHDSQSADHMQRTGQEVPVTTVPRAALRPTTTVVAPTTTSTSPAVAAALISAAGNTATYHLSSSSDHIVVAAKGACWLEVRANSPTGPVVYEGTLAAGQRHSVTGPAWIRLGDPPQVSVSVNGSTMQPPGAQLGDPLDLQFSVG